MFIHLVMTKCSIVSNFISSNDRNCFVGIFFNNVEVFSQELSFAMFLRTAGQFGFTLARQRNGKTRKTLFVTSQQNDMNIPT